jgi:hypothetical protein
VRHGGHGIKAHTELNHLSANRMSRGSKMIALKSTASWLAIRAHRPDRQIKRRILSSPVVTT